MYGNLSYNAPLREVKYSCEKEDWAMDVRLRSVFTRLVKPYPLVSACRINSLAFFYIQGSGIIHRSLWKWIS